MKQKVFFFKNICIISFFFTIAKHYSKQTLMHMKQNILKIISQCLNEKVPAYFDSTLGIKKATPLVKIALPFIVN